MADVIRMPRMSDTMEEGVIVAWLKNVGDAVEPGDVLAEVETDKATMELESFQEGVLLHIGVKEGSVPVDAIIAVIGEEGEDFQDLLKESATSPESKNKEEKATSAKTEKNTAPAVSADSHDSSTDKIKASPLAKKIASASGLNLGSISGSGPEGRIVRRDVEGASHSEANSISHTTSSSATGAIKGYISGETTTIPVTQMRKTIARRLGESKFGAPHFYLTVEINMNKAVEARNMLKTQTDAKVSFNDLVIKSSALALKKHPMINSSWLGDSIRINGDINIGVAVAVEDGLLVPVIKHADQKSLSTISSEVRELAGKAKEKKLSMEEMSGNTFSISNLGMFGIDEFTAIINPPDSCILAIGTIRKTPIFDEKGNVIEGNLMRVTLSCDHRVVDGATAALFLDTLKKNLENPLMMLV